MASSIASLELDRQPRSVDRRVELGHHSFAADHALPRCHQQPGTARQIKIGPATETDMTETLARCHRLARFDVADDASGYPPRDLHAPDQPAVRASESDRHALIVLARFLGGCVEEF